MLQPRPEKGYDEKDMKSKEGGQGLCRNAVDHIKIFVAPGVIIIKNFNVINSIPAQALAAPF